MRLAVEGEVNRMMRGEERCAAEVMETSHQPESFREGLKTFTYLDLICFISAPVSSVILLKSSRIQLTFELVFKAQQPDNKGYTTATAKSRNRSQQQQQQQMRAGLVTLAAVENV